MGDPLTAGTHHVDWGQTAAGVQEDKDNAYRAKQFAAAKAAATAELQFNQQARLDALAKQGLDEKYRWAALAAGKGTAGLTPQEEMFFPFSFSLFISYLSTFCPDIIFPFNKIFTLSALLKAITLIFFPILSVGQFQ